MMEKERFLIIVASEIRLQAEVGKTDLNQRCQTFADSSSLIVRTCWYFFVIYDSK